MDVIASAFRFAGLPLVCYYVVTVVVPIANGSGNTSSAFLEHMAFVLLAPPTFILLFALLRHAWRKLIRRSTRTHGLYRGHPSVSHR